MLDLHYDWHKIYSINCVTLQVFIWIPKVLKATTFTGFLCFKSTHTEVEKDRDKPTPVKKTFVVFHQV